MIPRIAREIATAACHRFTAHNIFFRSIRSATAPAGSVNREKGRDESVAMSERSNVESDLPRELSTQKAAVPWAAIAVPEIRVATQNLANAGFRKADQVDVPVIGGNFGRFAYTVRAGRLAPLFSCLEVFINTLPGRSDIDSPVPRTASLSVWEGDPPLREGSLRKELS